MDECIIEHQQETEELKSKYEEELAHLRETHQAQLTSGGGQHAAQIDLLKVEGQDEGRMPPGVPRLDLDMSDQSESEDSETEEQGVMLQRAQLETDGADAAESYKDQLEMLKEEHLEHVENVKVTIKVSLTVFLSLHFVLSLMCMSLQV